MSSRQRGAICSGSAASTPGMTETPIGESMPTWAAWTPLPSSSLCRFIAQLRSAAAAALTSATRGSGQIEPAPVLWSRVPAPVSCIARSTASVAVMAP